MIFEFEDLTIDVCVEKMKSLADKKWRCECPPCRIFREYASSLSDDVKQQFQALGLDIESPDEVYDAGKDENGNIQYGGWWNICGKIVKKGENPCRISDGFEVTFSDDCQYIPGWFRDSCCIQMKFIIRGSHLKRLGKEYKSEVSTTVSKKNTFIYHINDEVRSELGKLVGGELVKTRSDSAKIDGGNVKCHEADIYVKCPNESNLRKLTLGAARDIDTSFDGIDRMVLSASLSPVNAKESEILGGAGIVSCPHGCIKKIKVFESTIAGERDRVVYDSHLMIELESGEKIIIRVEPDGGEVLTVFTDVEDFCIEKYLRVSDTWFVRAEPIFDENNEVIGLKHFYQTETKVRLKIPE